jgi:hypothetical protein
MRKIAAFPSLPETSMVVSLVFSHEEAATADARNRNKGSHCGKLGAIYMPHQSILISQFCENHVSYVNEMRETSYRWLIEINNPSVRF